MQSSNIARLIIVAALIGGATSAHALTLSGGTATLNIDTAAWAATPFNSIDGVFGLTEDYTDLVAASFADAPPPLPALASSGSVGLALNPAGITTSLTGRMPQGTTLDFAPGDILGSWGAAARDASWPDLYLHGGEQIGFGGGIRAFIGEGQGVLLFGDFALRYDPTLIGTTVNGDDVLSGLVLVTNAGHLDTFAFPAFDTTFANLANAQIDFVDGTLTINADLLFAGAADFMASQAVTNEQFGTFSLTATAVPEPSSAALLAGALSLAGVGARRRRRA